MEAILMNHVETLPETLQIWRGPSAKGIEAIRTALLVIDLQVSFTEPGYPAYGPHAADVIPNVNRLAAVLRDAESKIVYTRHTVVEEGPHALPRWQANNPLDKLALDSLHPDSPGHALDTRLDRHPSDEVMDKYRYSAFLPISSPLDEALKSAGIVTVVITGTLTDVCCESSARDAYMLGYEVIFVSDATAAETDTAHNATLQAVGRYFGNVKSTDEVIANVRRPGRRRSIPVR